MHRPAQTQDYPIVIISMNRLSCLVQLLSWLKKAHHQEILIVDNCSDYPPLIEFYRTCPYKILYLRRRRHPRSVMFHPSVKQFIRGRYFVLTDPDVVPSSNCPLNALSHFRKILDRYPDLMKVGFGLRLDNLPSQYQHKKIVLAWEKQFWRESIEKNLFRAPIDTTFALYRPLPRSFSYTFQRSARTGRPYLAQHLPWYINSDKITAEERYYRRSLDRSISHWNQVKLPKFLTHFAQ